MTTTSHALRWLSCTPVRLLVAVALMAITCQTPVIRAAQSAAVPDYAAIDAYVEAVRHEMRVPGLA